MAYTVFRSDLLSGTDVAADLVSVKYHTVDGNTYSPAEISNGSIVKLEKLDATNRDVWIGVAPTPSTPISDIVIIGSEEVIYDERKKNLDEFINEKGKISRGYRARSGNVFGVTKEGLTTSLSTISVGNIVEVDASTQIKVVETLTSGSTKIGEIIAIEKNSRYTYYVIKIA